MASNVKKLTARSAGKRVVKKPIIKRTMEGTCEATHCWTATLSSAADGPQGHETNDKNTAQG